MINGSLQMAQNEDERRASIAKAVAANRAAKKKNKKRVDVYVHPQYKDGLKEIKSHFEDVKNEDQAVEKAIELALSVIKESK